MLRASHVARRVLTLSVGAKKQAVSAGASVLVVVRSISHTPSGQPKSHSNAMFATAAGIGAWVKGPVIPKGSRAMGTSRSGGTASPPTAPEDDVFPDNLSVPIDVGLGAHANAERAATPTAAGGTLFSSQFNLSYQSIALSFSLHVSSSIHVHQAFSLLPACIVHAKWLWTTSQRCGIVDRLHSLCAHAHTFPHTYVHCLHFHPIRPLGSSAQGTSIASGAATKVPIEVFLDLMHGPPGTGGGNLGQTSRPRVVTVDVRSPAEFAKGQTPPDPAAFVHPRAFATNVFARFGEARLTCVTFKARVAIAQTNTSTCTRELDTKVFNMHVRPCSWNPTG